jgi:vacuolar-type H+-ATPase subunit I/STV1
MINKLILKLKKLVGGDYMNGGLEEANKMISEIGDEKVANIFSEIKALENISKDIDMLIFNHLDKDSSDKKVYQSVVMEIQERLADVNKKLSEVKGELEKIK